MEIKKETIEAGEVLKGVLLSPFGDFPKGDIKQVCDSKAFTNLVANWSDAGEKEILVDFEHASEVDRIDSDTKAAAWVTNLQVTDEGLVGDMKFTDIGAEAVSNRRLRFLSPVWSVDEENRPAELKSIALTNKPNIKGKPVLNKESSEPQKKENPNMDKIKEALGLAPEASDEEVAAKVAEIVAANAEMKKAKEEADKAAAEKEAEDFAEANKAKCNKDVLKAQYLANKEAAKAIVAAIPDAPAKKEQKILNKGKEPEKNDLKTLLNKAKTPQEKIAAAQKLAAESIAE